MKITGWILVIVSILCFLGCLGDLKGTAPIQWLFYILLFFIGYGLIIVAVSNEESKEINKKEISDIAVKEIVEEKKIGIKPSIKSVHDLGELSSEYLKHRMKGYADGYKSGYEEGLKQNVSEEIKTPT